MSEFASRGHSSGYASPTHGARSAEVARTPVDLAADAIVRCVRDAELTAGSVRAIADAHQANDPSRWHEARDAARRHVAGVERSIEAARARQADATPEAREQIAAAERSIEELRANLAAHVEPPRGWRPVENESTVLDVLARPIVGPSGPAWDAKERDLKATLRGLPAADAKVIADRLRRPHAGDPLVTEFGRMTAERRTRLVRFLDDARRREAQDIARTDRERALSQPRGPQPLPDPLRAELETATGRSLGHVQLHTDDEGARTSDGARAVATGSSIHFGEGQYDPATDEGRELIAHEVAHVVQADAHQLAAPAANRDEDGTEAAELDADVFAARFRVRGGSASWTPTSGVVAGTPMKAPPVSPQQSDLDRRQQERKKLRRERAARNDTAAFYVSFNEGEIKAAIVARLGSIDPPMHPAVQWNAPTIGAHVQEAFDGALGERTLSRALAEYLYPADPLYLIDRHRPLAEGTAGKTVDGQAPTGQLFWRPEVGLALALEAELRVRESLARVLPRYAVQVDAKYPEVVIVADLVTSHPMDRIVARVLCDPRIVRPIAPARGNKTHGRKASTEAPLGSFRDGIEYLRDWRWLGASDPTMWNWIEVKEPRTATAEGVASTLWLNAAESQRAYAIVASPPFFRIPPKWAEQFDAAAAHRPRAAGHDDASRDTGALALASSGYATDVAIAQAAPERHFDRRGIPLPADTAQLAKLLDRSYRQLERARELLKANGLWELVLPALSWVGKHREHLLAIPDHRLIALTPVIEGQQEILFEAVGAIAELTKSLGVEPSGTVTSVLRRYAIAIGESHLLAPARAQLAGAHAAKAELPLMLLEQSAHDTRNSIADLRANETSTTFGSRSADKHVADLEQRIVDMRSRRAAGKTIDQDDALLVSAELKEEAVLARGRAIFLNLDNLAQLGGASTAAEIQAVAAELKLTILDRHAPIKASKLNGIDPRLKRETADATVAAADATNDALQEFLGRTKLDKRIPAWIETIESRARKLRAFQIASTILLLVATSVAAGFAGGLVSAAVRGVLLADAATAAVGVTWGVRVANATGAVAGLATDAAINAGVQVGMSGGSYRDGFADNLIANAAVRLALAPLHKAVAAWGGAGKDVANLGVWERNILRGKTVLKGGAVLTAEMITGAAVDYVVHRARRGAPPTEKEAMEWAIQGASMAIGAFASRWIRDFEVRIQGLVERGAHLRRRATNIRKLASEVERTGDKDAAMELLVQRNTALDEEAQVIHELARGGKLSAQTASTMTEGNQADRGAVAAASFKTMPLRLQGLEPDDASGLVWTGATEDIAIALHQAERSGLKVEVLERDMAARQWRVRLGGDELTIIETKLRGQPRAAKEDPTNADRNHANRYADSAVFMQQKWEAMQKVRIDARSVIEFDHVQLGFAFGGAVNQSTLPVTGEGLDSKVVIYNHAGTLSSRGDQQLGQDPSKFDAPGVRASEQAPKGTEWITSKQLDQALDVGRLETQTPAYRGTIVTLEARPKGQIVADAANPNAWKAPHRRFRVKVRDGHSVERWFYVDRFDNLGGLGPGKLSDAKAVAGAQLESMLARGQVLRADDPDYGSKLRGGRVLVWGGSPSGAWAAEPAMRPHGADVTILSDTRPPSDWPTLLREYEDLNHDIATHQGGHTPDALKARKAQIEALIADAHSGMKTRRNTKPGAAYEKPPTQRRGEDEVQIEFGTPSQIEPTSDGRVRVTVGTGEQAQTSVYDQVVIAHGQDPGAPGAPGGLLGEGATRDGAVPEGTIALRPVYGPARESGKRDILGLESIDPPGIQLKGAAFANKRMAPWVQQSERAAFLDAVKTMADEHAVTRDYGKISDDSRTVAPGVEVQRDRIPRANEVLHAKAYRLPGEKYTLELDPNNRDAWDDQVRGFFAENLRAKGKWVRVQQLGGGKSGAVVYRVWVDDNDVGVFKLFERSGAADEQRMLKLLEQAKLKHMTPVRERGRMKVDPKTGFDGALLMDAAKGTSVKEMIESLPTDQQRPAELRKLQDAAKHVARGLAEMHSHFESGRTMSNEAKLSDAKYFLERNFRKPGGDQQKVRDALGSDFERVKAEIEGRVLEKFLAAKVPATAYHGDANAGNFIVDGYDASAHRFKQVGMIDVGSMSYSVEGGRGTKTGAADIARFLGSLETLAPGALAPSELADVRTAFADSYFREYSKTHDLDRSAYAHAEKWYAIEMQIAVVRNHPSGKARLMSLLGLEVTP